MSSNFIFSGPRVSSEFQTFSTYVSSSGFGGAADGLCVIYESDAKYLIAYASSMTGLAYVNAAAAAMVAGEDKKYLDFNSTYSNFFSYSGSVTSDTPWAELSSDWEFKIFTTTASYSQGSVSGQQFGYIFRVPIEINGPSGTVTFAGIYNTTEITADFSDIFVSARKFQQGSLWAWGLDNAGQLGWGSNFINARSIPVTSVFTAPLYWKQVCSATYNGYGLTADGNISSWGYNIYGGIGRTGLPIGDQSAAVYSPLNILSGERQWRTLADGASEQIAAIQNDGSLWLWGRNNNGQLGINGITLDKATPITTFAGGNNWKQVSCGWRFTSAIKTDGTLWVWGSNEYSRLGIGTVSYPNPDIDVLTPVTTFAGGNDWKKVSCGFAQALAIKNDGTLWSWGLNAYGECGISDNTILFLTIPTQISFPRYWRDISAGRRYSAGITNNGLLFSWGSDEYGKLGIGNTNSNIIATDPYPVYQSDFTTNDGSGNWKKVCCGYFSTTAIKSDGTMWTWGRNDVGQLGIGNTSDFSPIPNQVLSTDGQDQNWRTFSMGPFSGFTLALRYDGTVLYP